MPVLGMLISCRYVIGDRATLIASCTKYNSEMINLKVYIYGLVLTLSALLFFTKVLKNLLNSWSLLQTHLFGNE